VIKSNTLLFFVALIIIIAMAFFIARHLIYFKRLDVAAE
jgi:hypothetical protein